MKPSIHRPFVRIELSAGPVEVHELSWPDALHLLNEIRALITDLFDEQGNLALDLRKLSERVIQNTELVTWLFEHSARQPDGTRVTKAALEALSVTEVIDLASESVVLNVGGIFEHIKKASRRVGEAVRPAALPSAPDTSRTQLTPMPASG